MVPMMWKIPTKPWFPRGCFLLGGLDDSLITSYYHMVVSIFLRVPQARWMVLVRENPNRKNGWWLGKAIFQETSIYSHYEPYINHNQPYINHILTIINWFPIYDPPWSPGNAPPPGFLLKALHGFHHVGLVGRSDGEVSPDACPMVLDYLPTRLGDFWGFYVGKYGPAPWWASLGPALFRRLILMMWNHMDIFIDMGYGWGIIIPNWRTLVYSLAK